MDFVDNLKLVIRYRMISVFCDNKSIVMLIKTRANVSKGKHIDYHYIQYIVEMAEIRVWFIPSNEMVAGLTTMVLT